MGRGASLVWRPLGFTACIQRGTCCERPTGLRHLAHTRLRFRAHPLSIPPPADMWLRRTGGWEGSTWQRGFGAYVKYFHSTGAPPPALQWQRSRAALAPANWAPASRMVRSPCPAAPAPYRRASLPARTRAPPPTPFLPQTRAAARAADKLAQCGARSAAESIASIADNAYGDGIDEAVRADFEAERKDTLRAQQEMLLRAMGAKLPPGGALFGVCGRNEAGWGCLRCELGRAAVATGRMHCPRILPRQHPTN